MSELNKALAAPHIYKFKDKEYKVSLVTNRVKAEFEKRMMHKAVQAARDMKTILEPDEYEMMLKKINDDYIAGRYAFESKFSVGAMQNPKGGFLTLCSVLFNTNEEEMYSIILEDTLEVRALIDTIITESFPDVKHGDEKN